MSDTNYITESVQWVRQNCSGIIHVGFSGGKDSICTAGIMQMAGIPYELHYQYTGIDPPEILRFVRRYYPECIIHFPKRTFWRDLSVHCPPNGRIRWCCTLLKKTPSIPRILGIRAEESISRGKYQRINNIKGVNVYYPILSWNLYQVWDFIEKFNLPYPKMYDEGFDRIGCIICPYHSEKTGRVHELYRVRWPNYFIAWEKAIAKLYAKRVGQGKKMYYSSPQEFCDKWYLNDMARWYAD